jgi:hypothetical protein
MHRAAYLLPFLLNSSALAEGGRTFRILFLAAPADAPETLHLSDGAATREVELPRLNFSPVYQLPAESRAVHLLPAAPASPAEIPPGAPAAVIPASITDFYLLVSSDPANTIAPVKMQIIDANAEKFRKGQMLWFNLTANRVGGRLGATGLNLDPNSRLITGPPAERNEDFHVNLSYRMPGNARLYPLCETKWRHDPVSRTVLFVLPQQGNRTPRILGIPDCREQDQAPESP